MNQIVNIGILNGGAGRHYLNIGLVKAYDILKTDDKFDKGFLLFKKKEDADEMEWQSEKDQKTYVFGSTCSTEEEPAFISTPPLFSVSQRKKITKTTVNGEADVIEHWNTQGYNIKMRGLLVNMENHEIPKAHIIALKSLFQAKSIIAITKGKILKDTYGIDKVFLTEWKTQLLEGYEDTVSYDLTAISLSSKEFILRP